MWARELRESLDECSCAATSGMEVCPSRTITRRVFCQAVVIVAWSCAPDVRPPQRDCMEEESTDQGSHSHVTERTRSSPRIWTHAWDMRSWACQSLCATVARVLCFYLNTRHSQRARTRPDGPLLLHSKAKIGSKTPTAEDSPQQSQMCAGQHNLEPLAEVERALLVVEVLHAPHPEGLGLLLVVGGEHFCRHKGEGTRVSQTIQSTRTADPRPRDAHAVPSLPLSCRQAAPAHGHQLATGPGGSGGLRTDRTTPTGCSPSP